MVRKCSVKNCDYNLLKIKRTLFTVPSDIATRKTWSTILNCEFKSQQCFVCEKHFNPNDINQGGYYGTLQGKVIIDEPSKVKKLKKNVLPILCDDSIESIIPNKKLKLANDEKQLPGSSRDFIESETDDAVETKINYPIDESIVKNFNAVCSNEPENDPTETENSEIHTLDSDESDESDFEDLSHLCDDKDNAVNESNQKELYLSLLKNLLEEKVQIRLPTENWAVRIKKDIGTIFFYFENYYLNESGIGESNTWKLNLSKMITVGKNGVLLIVNNQTIDLKNYISHSLTTLEELENCLQLVDSLKVCQGGPSIQKYSNTYSECAFKENEFWRHKNCPRVFANNKKSFVCDFCSTLTKRLWNAENRAKIQSTKNNATDDDIKYVRMVGVNITPRTKRRTQLLKKKNNNQQVRLTRKQKIIDQLQNELSNCQKEIKKKKMETINDALKNYNIAEEQVLVIKEILETSKAKSSKGFRYSKDWLMTCFMLRIRSPATYNLLRDGLGILPLPSKTTITRYLRKANVGVGFDKEFFKSFQYVIKQNPNAFANHGILAFDEMSVRAAPEVNVRDMKFNGLVDLDVRYDCSNFSDKNLSNNISKEQLDNNNDQELENDLENLDKAQDDIYEAQFGLKATQQTESPNTDFKDCLADHALVFMFSSLFSKVQQPIGMFTCKGATPSKVLAPLILTAIIACERAGVIIHAIVCDGAQTNRGLWTHFGLSANLNEEIKCSFDNPADPGENYKNEQDKIVKQRKIFFISDIPHLFKCIRNNLLSRKEFKINNVFVRWQFYRNLYEEDSKIGLATGKRTCPKLTRSHIFPNNFMKMRVSLATQVFSSSVASAMKTYKEDPKYEHKFRCSEGTIDFTERMNDLFDQLNSSSQFTGLSLGSSRFKILENHLKWIDSWEEEIMPEVNNLISERDSAIKIEKTKQKALAKKIQKTKAEKDEDKKAIAEIKKKYKPLILQKRSLFLSDSTSKGLRITITSVIQLATFLLNEISICDPNDNSKNLRVQYILTKKLNQDCLERFFGIIRQAGATNDHPMLPTFMQLYHLLSIYKIIRPPKFGNCSNSEDLQNKRPLITLEEFQKCFSNKDDSYKQTHIHNLKLKIEDLIEKDEWDILETDENDLSVDMIDLIIYSNCGYICRKMLKLINNSTKCEMCKKAFISVQDNSKLDLAKFVNNRNNGRLIYSNVRLFKILKGVDDLFNKYINQSEMYYKILDDVGNNKVELTFPCDQHKSDIIPRIIHDYVAMRMFQYTRLLRRDISKESKDKKKEAKLKKN